MTITAAVSIQQILKSKTLGCVELAYQLAKSQNLTEECYYLIHFGDMLTYLRSFEHIDILEYNFLAASPESIEKVENEIGTSLDPELRRFYSECNGMRLRWRDKRRKNSRFSNNTYYHSPTVDGEVNIQGIEDIYYSNKLEAYKLYFLGKVFYDEEINHVFHLFDYLSDYYILAYTKGVFCKNPLLAMGIYTEDACCDFSDSILLTIPDYLELVFHSCGSIRFRQKFCKNQEELDSPLYSLDKHWLQQFPLPDFNRFPHQFFLPAPSFSDLSLL